MGKFWVNIGDKIDFGGRISVLAARTSERVLVAVGTPLSI